MGWKWNYGDRVLVLPAAALAADPTPEQLKLLLWLASDASLADKPIQLAKLADCKPEDVRQAMAFWSACGVLSGESDEPAGVAEWKKTPARKPAENAPKQAVPVSAEVKTPLQRADELPTYTTAELADMMEKRSSLRVLADESQQIFGKIFNMHELNILFGLVDYLKLDEEYILLLLAHCKRMEIKSMRYVEKYAISLMDQGIETAAALEERVQTLEEMHTLEGKIRAMFGLKSRALTTKEKKLIEGWLGFGYGEDVIRLAYEITVNSIEKPSLAYANSILERWNAEGLKTAEEITRRIQAEREAKEGRTTLGNSFDTDDFFEAALQRSMREDG